MLKFGKTMTQIAMKFTSELLKAMKHDILINMMKKAI